MSMDRNSLTNLLNRRGILQNDILANSMFLPPSSPNFASSTQAFNLLPSASELVIENFNKWISNNVPVSNDHNTSRYVHTFLRTRKIRFLDKKIKNNISLIGARLWFDFNFDFNYVQLHNDIFISKIFPKHSIYIIC